MTISTIGKVRLFLKRHQRINADISSPWRPWYTPIHYSFLIDDPCVYCGYPRDTFDHITPVSAGGKTADNFAPACLKCNREKKDMSLLHFLIDRITK